jgi:hypothetical protein
MQYQPYGCNDLYIIRITVLTDFTCLFPTDFSSKCMQAHLFLSGNDMVKVNVSVLDVRLKLALSFMRAFLTLLL